MSQHPRSALAAAGLLALALAACASTAQRAEAPVAAVADEPPSVPEFHDARIGEDALRSRLPGE